MIPLVVPLPIKTVSEPNQRDGWRSHHRRSKDQRATVGLVMQAHLAIRRIMPPCLVTLTRIAPSPGLDDDNLRGAFKHVRDGVADALGVDDRDSRVVWQYAQKRGAAKQYGVIIEVRSA